MDVEMDQHIYFEKRGIQGFGKVSLPTCFPFPLSSPRSLLSFQLARSSPSNGYFYGLDCLWTEPTVVPLVQLDHMASVGGE
uniref:Uncharacterized protein n=1 Tax=Salix viminalis TaxID=40686 RepID=A0A6N2LCU4_SALVM